MKARRILMIAAAAAAGVAACQRTPEPAKKQAESLERRADTVEQRGKEEVTKAADELRAKADVIKEGLTYEVTAIDKASRTVTIHPRDMEKAEKVPQAGKDIVLTYDDLGKYDLAKHREGAVIADELKTGSNVHVFMDASGTIMKIDY